MIRGPYALTERDLSLLFSPPGLWRFPLPTLRIRGTLCNRMAMKFKNPWPHETHGLLDILRWKFGAKPMQAPEIPDAPDGGAEWVALDPESAATPPDVGWRVTWLGHASFLLQGAGLSLLVDPVFSDYCAPLPLPSLRRLVGLPIRPENFPLIDGVLLTHGHYDHLDLSALKFLGKDTPLIVAEGHAGWLAGKGFRQVRELPWNASVELVPGVRVTATPAQHFTARTPFDRNCAHWCGFVIDGAGCRLWHAGDSGWCPAFEEIGILHGPIDFGMIPIGAYNPRQIMNSMHMNPEEAVEVFLKTRCRRAVAMHWGTFRLTDEPMWEPVIRLERAVSSNPAVDGRFIHGRVGESWTVAPAIF